MNGVQTYDFSLRTGNPMRSGLKYVELSDVLGQLVTRPLDPHGKTCE
jgi:hypothetical protein